jgi:hypothetical protein
MIDTTAPDTPAPITNAIDERHRRALATYRRVLLLPEPGPSDLASLASAAEVLHRTRQQVEQDRAAFQRAQALAAEWRAQSAAASDFTPAQEALSDFDAETNRVLAERSQQRHPLGWRAQDAADAAREAARLQRALQDLVGAHDLLLPDLLGADIAAALPPKVEVMP